MADDAPASSSTASSSDASPPTYADNPADPSTWSPAFLAQVQSGIAQRAAADALAAAQTALAVLQPCAFLLAPAWAQQADAIKALSKAADDDLLTTWAQNTATTMTGLATEFRTRFAAVGGVVPTS